jgi:cytochrome c oxidase cbb3-type subunit 3
MAEPNDGARDEVRGHRFDDIEEYDNPLPRWWVGVFYLTIAIAVVYLPWVHLVEGNRLIDEYDAEMKRASALQQARRTVWDEAKLAAACAAPGWQERAAATYKQRCAACHRADGGGVVGPAFTDDHYLHGGGHVDIAKVIEEGVPAKGMVAWGKILKPNEITDLVCLVRDFRGKLVEKPKAPQGERWQE